MTRNNSDFHGVVQVPIDEVNEFIPNDFQDHDWDNPIRMKHLLGHEDCVEIHEHPGEQGEYYENLKNNIAKNGILDPIWAHKLDDGNTVLTEGHHRVMIATELGLSHVPVKFWNYR